MLDITYRIIVRCDAPHCDARRAFSTRFDSGITAALDAARDAARRDGWTINLDLPNTGTRCPTHGPLVPAPTGAAS